MNLIKNHINNIVSQDYLIKYKLKNTKIVPKLEKVVLSVKFNNLSKGAVVSALEIVGFTKPYLTTSKVNAISLNLRKGDLVGAKLILRKAAAYDFIQALAYEILPYSRNSNIASKDGKTLHCIIKDIFVLDSTSALFDYLRSVKALDLAITISNASSLKFPLQFYNKN